MTVDTALEEAGARMRSVAVPQPPPFDAVRSARRRDRQRQRAMAGGAIITLVLAAGVALRSAPDGEVPLVTGGSTSSTGTTPPSIATIHGTGLDVIGSGAFRITANPGKLRGTSDRVDDGAQVDVLGAPLVRVSDVSATDDHGTVYRAESFDAPTDVAGQWLAGAFPAGTTTAPLGSQRLGAVERSGSSASFTWAYDELRVVRASITQSSGVASREVLVRFAGLVVAADRLPRPAKGSSLAPPSDVTGLGYLEAEQVLLSQGYAVRVGVQLTADWPDGPATVVQVAPGTTSGTAAQPLLLVTARVSSKVQSSMFDKDGLPQAPASDGFTPVGGRDSLASFIHGRDLGMDLTQPQRDDSGGGVLPVPAMLPGGELVGTWEHGFVPLDVLVDPNGEIQAPSQPMPIGPRGLRDGQPVDRPPFDPPDGWITVELDGVQLSVPPSWVVIRDDASCPVAAHSVLVGARTQCPLPPPDQTWISLRPLLAQLTDFAATCQPGDINGFPGCDADGATERIAFNGLDVLLEISYGSERDTVHAITDTIRVEDAQDPPPDMGALNLGSAWVQALYAHDCDALYDLASTELRAGRTRAKYAADCRPTLPNGTIQIASLHSPSASPTKARVLVNVTVDGTTQMTYELLITNRYDLAKRSTAWTVLSADQAGAG